MLPKLSFLPYQQSQKAIERVLGVRTNGNQQLVALGQDD
jgi:hypothetical protein